MDPVIGTFTARDIVNTPDFVNQVYLEHVETHMSMGDSSIYVDSLLRWAQTNKGTVIGAISGEYGYGKTSMAIHLWNQCEKASVIAVPPFEWHRLQDIVEATWAWVCFRLNQIQPESVSAMDQLYEKYKEISIQEFAEEEDIAVSKVEELLARKRISLEAKPEDVIEYLSEINKFLEKEELGLNGPVIFTDELQVTMARYLAEHRSRDEFMQDLFELLNSLINRQGNFGLVIGLPLSTEALINDIRGDILQRLQQCNLFMRPNNLYDRSFPIELWGKFSEVFEFDDISDIIIPSDTLDSIGQIAFRDDLGAGPRTVVEAMRFAINKYDESGQSFSPVDLMDAYLAHQIAFDAGGKLITAVTEVLQSKDVEQIPKGDQVIKLMAAFPMGCPEDRFKFYGIQDTKDEITKRLYTEYLYKFPEGVSLRKLAPTERGAEPRFIELTKDFIQTYSESERDIAAAIQAFKEVVIQEQLLKSRRADQIEGWIPDSKTTDQYIGTFDRKYPQRRLSIRVSSNREKFVGEVEEFGLFYWFDTKTDNKSFGSIRFESNNKTKVLFRLNLHRNSSKPLNIPYIEELGYPMRKVSPLFMLALIQHLRTNAQSIPEDEKRIQIKPLERSLIDYSIQLLFGSDLLENSEIESLSKVGLALSMEVFSRMCRERYSDYETLMTTGRWSRNYTKYLGALQSQLVIHSVGILRGNRLLETKRNKLMALFGENKAQPISGLAENLSIILEIELGPRDDSAPSTVRFKQHPAEDLFMEELRNSDDETKSGQYSVKVLDQHKGLGLLRDMGYRDEEISIILELLKARRLIDFDIKKQIFLEVLESPDERREAILTTLSDLSKRADKLSQIPDFDNEWFLAEATHTSKEVQGCNDIEKLENYQTHLSQLRDFLNKFINKWEEKVRQDFESIRLKSENVISESLPSELARPIKGDVKWVRELLQCQVLLKDKYQRSIAEFRDVDKKVANAWKIWSNSSPHDSEALVALYSTNISSQVDIRNAQINLKSSQGYLKSLIAWNNVLNASSRAYREASGCEVSYKEDRFRINLDDIFNQISDRFEKERLEALGHHEIYIEKIQEIQSEIDNWLRRRRDKFMQSKVFYEDTLKSFGVERFNLHATFDPFDPDMSNSILFSEVLEKTLYYINSLNQDLGRYHTEILYAERVARVDVSKPKMQVHEVRDHVNEIMDKINEECVKKKDCYSDVGEKLGELSKEVINISRNMRGVLKKRAPSDGESIILEQLQDPKGVDLSVIITDRLAIEGDEFSLDSLLEKITSLFKKNQIIINIQKRR